MSADDCTVYMDVFGNPATLAGSPLTAMVDTASLLELDGIITQAPSAVVLATEAPAAAAGQTFVAAAVDYVVRQVLKMPPDGMLLRLVLARA